MNIHVADCHVAAALGQSTAASGRRCDLDWIRIGAFGLLILYHVGMLYVPWNFHVKSTPAGPALEAFMLALNPWRLALLFLVSGAATRFMAQKFAPGTLAKRRASRLLVPLVFGMLVVVAPQPFFEVAEKYGFDGSFLDFYARHYLALTTFKTPTGADTGLVLPTWNHLWFVVYLFAYTMVAAAALAFAPGLVARLERQLDCAPATLILVAPALLLGVLRVVVAPHFPVTHALIGDWYAHAVFFFAFALGFLLARGHSVWTTIERLRYVALAAAVAAYAGFMVLRGLPANDALRALRALLYGIDQWCAILAILGFGRRFLSGWNPRGRAYLADAVFAYYIIHQTAIIALAHWLKPLNLSIGVEATAIIAATAVACGLGYEAVRRVAWLRPLFGVPEPRHSLSRA